MKKGLSMKNETQMRKRNKNNGGKPESKRIHCEFASPTAESVAIAGSFNDWQPNVTPMIALGQGRWAKDLALPPGDYEYCLVVDGQWMPDLQAAETVPNPFGGVNSVRKVGNGG
ncbi:MAG: isoamylase early set domain-containing protein [Chloroflexi bacterium]|nr:isoamylase early set domain-containing protein [Chloroflexota bacterium]